MRLAAEGELLKIPGRPGVAPYSFTPADGGFFQVTGGREIVDSVIGDIGAAWGYAEGDVANGSLVLTSFAEGARPVKERVDPFEAAREAMGLPPIDPGAAPPADSPVGDVGRAPLRDEMILLGVAGLVFFILARRR